MMDAAAVTSFVTFSTFGLVGLTSSPIRAAEGRSSRNSPSCFAPSSALEEVHTGRIAARPGKTDDKTKLDWIPGGVEHDWNRCGRSFSRDCRRGRACDDHSRLAAHQLRRHCGQLIVMSLGPTVFDRNIAPLHVTGFGQTLAEYRQRRRKRPRRTGVKKTDHRHRRLLRARRERPRGCLAAEKCDEVAPSHSIARRGQSLPNGGVVRHSKIGGQM